MGGRERWAQRAVEHASATEEVVGAEGGVGGKTGRSDPAAAAEGRRGCGCKRWEAWRMSVLVGMAEDSWGRLVGNCAARSGVNPASASPESPCG